jgi:hypothetical protein
LVFAQARGPEGGHLESVAGDFGCSHGCKIPPIKNSALARRANLLAEYAKKFVPLLHPVHDRAVERFLNRDV